VIPDFKIAINPKHRFKTDKNVVKRTENFMVEICRYAA
jgi:hypothetical protein